jgi:hypothetical protein
MHLIFPENTHIETQPELKSKMFTNKKNYLLWCLLIKTDIYKKAIYILWPIIINYKIKFQEDYIVTFMIVILSRKYKYFNNFALIHILHSNMTSNNFISKNEFHLGVFFAGYIIYDFYIKNNPRYINIIINYIKFFEYYIKIGKNKFPLLFKFLMKKILNNDYLSLEERKNLTKLFLISDNEYFNASIEANANSSYQKIYDNKELKNFNFSPKISIIIVCSEYKYLEQTINSIQNQNYIFFEIILVYDNDEKNHIMLIKKYIKQFNNIKLINNKIIKGFIYSISIGILNSKGLYIMILKPTYILATKDVLNKLYNIIIKNKNIDILEFILLIGKEKDIYNKLIIYKCQHFNSNFNLTEIKYNKNHSEIDLQKELLINKLIKKNIFLNVVNKYKLIELEKAIFNYYDNIFLFCLQNEKIIFIKVNIYGIIQIGKKNNDLKINYLMKDKNYIINDSIFYINFLFKYSKNTFANKEIALNEFFDLMSVIYNRFNKLTNESIYLYEKFINCKYITQINKSKLRLYFNSLIN